MPIKTNYLKLDKIQAHEYYNTETENTNLDKIDGAIQDHEERTKVIENKISRNNQLTIDLKSFDRAASVTDSFSGTCDYQIEGEIAHQLVKNGNFRQGFDNPFHTRNDTWMSLMETYEISKTEKTLVLTDRLKAGWAGMVQADKYEYPGVGDKYYIFARMRVLDDGCNRFGLHFVKVSDWQINGDSIVIQAPIKTGEWYDVHGVTTMTFSEKSSLLIGGNYPAEQATIGKRIEVDLDYGVFAIKLSDDDLSLSADELKMKYVDNGYFEGLKFNEKSLVKSRSKNLFNIEEVINLIPQYATRHDSNSFSIKGGQSLVNPYKLWNGEFKEKTQYSFKYFMKSSHNDITGGVFMIVYTDGKKEILPYATSTTENAYEITSEVDKSISYVDITYNSANAIGYYRDMMVIEGKSVPDQYTCGMSSIVTFEDPLAKLSNGAMDKIIVENARAKKIINTNVGRDKSFYKLKEEDILLLATGKENFDAVKIKYHEDSNIQYTPGSVLVEGFGGAVKGTDMWDDDDPKAIGKVLTQISGNGYFLIVEKGQYSSFEQAKTDLIGRNICYQLMNTEEINLSHDVSQLSAYEDYTYFNSNSTIRDLKYPVDFSASMTSLNNSISSMSESVDKYGQMLENQNSKKIQLDLCSRTKSVNDSSGGACDFEIEGTVVENIIGVATQGIYLYPDGKVYTVSNTDTQSYIVNCESNRTYFMKKHSSSSRLAISSFNSYPKEGDIGTTIVYDHNLTELTFTTNSNAKYIMIYFTNASEDPKMTLTKAEVDSYFKGIQPTRGVSVESVGKNLLDSSKVREDGFYSGEGIWQSDIGYDSFGKYNVEGGKQYILNTGDGLLKTFWNGDTCVGYFIGSGVFTIPYDATSVILTVQKTTDKSTVMFEEGTAATTYEPYKSTRVVFDGALARLPNGSIDKIVRENGKNVKYVETNVGRDGEFYIVKENDIKQFAQGDTNIQRISIPESVLAGLVNAGNTDTQGLKVFVEGYSPRKEKPYDTVDMQNTVYFSGGSLVIAVPNNTYSSESDAKKALAGTKIAYQLAIPYRVDLSDKTEPLNSYDEYTQFSVEDGVVENEKANVSLSDTGYWHINISGSSTIDDSDLNQKVKQILSIMYKGREIKNLGETNENLYVDNGVRWFILKSTVDTNNIDVNQLYVTYTTSESNGQANVKITYNADLSSAVSSNASAINTIGEQVDKTTKEVNRLGEPLEWIEPTLLNGWIAHSLSSVRPLYARDINGFVHLRGVIKQGAISSTLPILQLPEGFRPNANSSFSAISNKNIGVVVGAADGKFYVTVGSTSDVNLDIIFYAGE